MVTLMCVYVCTCVFYMADDVVAVLFFCGLVNLKTLNIETTCINKRPRWPQIAHLVSEAPS